MWRRGVYLHVLAIRVKYSNLYTPSRNKSRALHVCGCEVRLHIPKHYTTLTDVCDRAPFYQSIGWYVRCYIDITSTSLSEYSSTRSPPSWVKIQKGVTIRPCSFLLLQTFTARSETVSNCAYVSKACKDVLIQFIVALVQNSHAKDRCVVMKCGWEITMKFCTNSNIAKEGMLRHWKIKKHKPASKSDGFRLLRYVY
jgi:hypothetical protein